MAVRFARRSGRDAADDDVAAMVAQHPEPSSLMRGDVGRARSPTTCAPPAGEVVGAGAFLRQLDDAEQRLGTGAGVSASLGSGPCS